MSNDLGDDGGSRRRTTAGDNVGDDVGNVGDGDNGGNDAGNNAGKRDGRDAGGERGGGFWQRTRRQRRRQRRRRRLPIAGVVAFYCEDIFVWYFYDVWGESARSHLPSHSRHA